MLETLIAALIAGATTSTKGIANDAVKSLYFKLKEFMGKKMSRLTLDHIENDPDSEQRRSDLADSIRAEKITDLDQAVELANQLLCAVETLTGDKSAGDYATAHLQPNKTETILPIFLDLSSKKRLVKKFPIGPAVDIGLVPIEPIAEELSRDRSNARAQTLVNNANRLRKTADPEFPDQSICVFDLPDPQVVGFYSFWFHVIDQSMVKGPRMIVSLLLSLPLNGWMVHGEKTYQKIEKELSNG